MKRQFLAAENYCCSVRDGTHDTPVPTSSGFKLVTGKHIKNGVIDPYDAYYISEDDFNSINARSRVEKWDVLMSMIGTVGEAAVVADTPLYAIKNVALFKCGGSEIKGKWLAYYLRSEEAKGHMRGNMKGSSQQFLSLKQLRSLPIPIASEHEMKKIVNALSAYDDLIENNRKQIKLLEEAAQRLYKEWFIDLRFPGYETTPIIDGIPSGWEKKKLIDIADVTMGQSPKSEFYNSNRDGLPFHQGVGSYGVRFVIDETYSSSFTRIAEAGDILFSVRAPVGRLNVTLNKIAIGRGLAAIKHKNNLQSFLYYMLKEHFFKDDIIGNGSIFASITKDELTNFVLLVPRQDICEKFNTLTKDIDSKVMILDKQIQSIKETRDRLLPKLMTGELEVNHD